LNQTTPYNFQKVQAMQEFININIEKAEKFTDDQLYQMSLLVEPRGWDGVSSIENTAT